MKAIVTLQNLLTFATLPFVALIRKYSIAAQITADIAGKMNVSI
jgi:hypothetical protein